MILQHIGFTGTKAGMTDRQSMYLKRLLSLFREAGATTLHHGDCVGADEQAGVVAGSLGYSITIHPPIDSKLRAFSPYNRSMPPADYLERNRDIVNDTDFLLACPKENKEVLRSGTWSTIRYARRYSPLFKILWP